MLLANLWTNFINTKVDRHTNVRYYDGSDFHVASLANLLPSLSVTMPQTSERGALKTFYTEGLGRC